jgi:nicotinate-nucleotide adenylyltransferase
MKRRRIALYGGTFDPVHVGHLTVARNLTEYFALDEVLFIPAFIAPHKRAYPPTPAVERYAMLVLATQHEPRFRVSTAELDAPEKPYTVETLARFRAEFKDAAQIFFVIGADSWAEIRAWRDWEKLLLENSIIVVTRPGYDLSAAHVGFDVQSRILDLRDADRAEVERALEGTEPRIFWTNAAMVDVSATEIRRAVRAHRVENLAQLVTPTVADYILKYNLYEES